MPLRPYIFDTAFNPGTGPFALLGPPAGRRGYIPGFASGAKAFYVADDGTGTAWEEGWGVVTAASPNNTLTRNVTRNSADTTTPISFTGAVDVYCFIPSDQALFIHPEGYVDLRGAELRGMRSFNGAGGGGIRNRVINPKFEVWQDGTSFAAVAGEADVADGWHVSYDGTGATVAVTRGSALQAGSEAVLDAGCAQYLSFRRTVAGSGGTYCQLRTSIEGVANLAGKAVVAGFWARADAARSVTVSLAQNFGTGGAPSATVNTALGSVNIGTSWAWYSATTALASIGGKMIGTNNDSRLMLVFALPVNTVMGVDLADVHLLEGTALTAEMAEPLAYADALRRCQRYRTVFPLGLVGAAANTNTVMLAGRTPVPMRAVPSVAWLGAGTLYVPGVGSLQSSQAPAIATYDPVTGAIAVSWGGFAGLNPGQPCMYHLPPTSALLTATL